ncbi:MAG: TetR/AcrR family transcriptional regulator [Acidimicrobiia bacterium]|nr:TetR/AcrR family transcriptional regulator [Acidimicrobiia bacterium]
MASRGAQLSRELVVDAARELVARDGLEGLSLRRVGAKLGVSAPALYAYVDNKSDLLRGIAEVEFESLLEQCTAVESLSPIERIRAQVTAYVEHALAHPSLFQVMFLFRPGVVPQPAVDELPAATKVFTLGSVAIEEAMRTGALRPQDPFAVALALWAAAHGTATVLLADLNLGADLDRLVLDTVIDNLLRGLAAPTI